MPKRRGVFRTRHKTRRGKTVFAKRDKKGRFVDIQRASTSRDRRIKAKTKVRAGYGFRGDIRRKKTSRKF